jgi:mRNA-degrading endonuclease RelE of RelBE toxin-antitoxin system
MPFRVIYHTDAESELIRLWLDSPVRQEFNQALNRIDQFLALNPRKYGSEVSEELYAIEVSPLKVFIEIDEQNVSVKVTGIGIIER